MAFTQADVDALKTAIAKGVRRLRMNGEEVEYQSAKDMRAALSMMEAEVAGQTRGTITVSYPYTTRGL